jgi:23S rRNA pseudouridine1911/1915/1917 synthase
VVHRLDKETSGVMVLAKTPAAYYHLIKEFKERTIDKEYLALVWGRIQRDTFTIDMPLTRDTRNRLRMKVGFLHARKARTDVCVLSRFSAASYVRLKIHTGRMHQIRVHLKFIGHPVIGDTKYGKKDGYETMMLHAHRLAFTHPATGRQVQFRAPVPAYFSAFIEEQGKN